MNDRLNPNETLPKNTPLYSANRLYTLVLQDDGNLVLHNDSNNILWDSKTGGKVVSRCIMQGDGNLVIYGSDKVLWASNSNNNPGAYLIVQNDGNVVIYNGSRAVWASNTVVRSLPSTLTEHILDVAAQNPQFAARLYSEPSNTFLAAGMTLSSVGGLRTDFNDYFRKEGEQVLTQIQAAHTNNKTTSLMEIDAQIESLNVKCTACKVGAYAVAGAIIAVGAVAIASLTEELPVVITVASFLNISRGSALEFIKSIASQLEEGVSKVAGALCEKLGAC